MKYALEEELKKICAPYAEHPLESYLREAGSSFVYKIYMLLEDVDTLIFQRHPQASIFMVIEMLKQSLALRTYNEFQPYLHRFQFNKSQKKWFRHFELSDYYDQLSTIHNFMYGTWKEIDGKVFLGRAFVVPEELRAGFVTLMHRAAVAHVKDLISRLRVSNCIKDWEFYAPEVEAERLIEPYAVVPYRAELAQIISELCIRMEVVLKTVERHFEYRLSVDFYSWLIKLLAATAYLDSAILADALTRYVKEGAEIIPKDSMLALISALQDLRQIRVELPNEPLIEDPDAMDAVISTVQNIAMQHVTSVIERLEAEQLVAIERTKDALLTRYRSYPAKDKKMKEALRTHYNDFLSKMEKMQADKKNLAASSSLVPGHLFAQASPTKQKAASPTNHVEALEIEAQTPEQSRGI